MKKLSIAGLINWLFLEFVNLQNDINRKLFMDLIFPFLWVIVKVIFAVVSFGFVANAVGFIGLVSFLVSLLESFLISSLVWIAGLNLMKKLGGSRKYRLHPPSLKRISDFADFWGLDLRKRIKATAGDFGVEVNRLHKEKRYRMAKWNVVLAWGYAIWYVLRGPYDLVKGALGKALKGL